MIREEDFITLPLDIMDVIETKTPEQRKAEMLSRHDLFVRNYNICLLTSIEKQSNMKIAAVANRIKKLSQDILKPTNIIQLPLPGMEEYKPEIDLYVKCEDKEVSDKAKKLISVLYTEFLMKGIRIKLHALNGKEDKVAMAISNTINNYQISLLTKMNMERTK